MLTSIRALYSISVYMASVKIKLPENNNDPELAALVECANNPQASIQQLQEQVGTLKSYLDVIESRRLEKIRESDLKAEKAKREKEERERNRGKWSSKLHKIMEDLAPSISKAFGVILKVVGAGMKILETTSFIAAELTFQTHYEVALKAIMLFVTVCRLLILHIEQIIGS